jgi:hypothetical protein
MTPPHDFLCTHYYFFKVSFNNTLFPKRKTSLLSDVKAMPNVALKNSSSYTFDWLT